ncbi:MAG: SUF system NifU family Fe-S cluster assembly protein [Candidatus Marinimicrobia bacterium]|jgi:nitrogen fixation NifU-like protein|nr:SUF system NifU family Fe-S cluster assembly protein [Candidatus Neomarinimicrobiota bacterium]MBT3632435.1 SUF system NifU family Fe-S cluster assembly protein [Candidatus Neomarinimicrobiota bacterium]MBT3825285.1 SUF system NifU family Fe-S cluster assembly protein [Candidatus Neomarinimicrobiota bacterium]MBT4130718.1 SUF system NifU family Fe-S cluster assembly protein [Candidatus Neomarinimicrobiota bacterium]MBT4295442.1 SUF system NifU family Fe-S cluster assembly protein [Candidatus
MTELRELYQEVILDHNKNPRNFKKLELHSHHANGHNPLCGDKLELFLDVVDGIIKDISFVGSGCAISTSSASLMTQFLRGKSIEETRHYFENFHDLVTGKELDQSALEGLGKLAVFAGVQEFPARVKCASLSWHTLMNALDSTIETAATE